MAVVTLEKLVKTYPEKKGGGIRVVHGIDLEVRPGEFMVVVGPSGCGKSTTLRMIAGLELLGVRPAGVRVAIAPSSDSAGKTCVAMVELAESMGAETLLHLSTGGRRFIARVRPTDRFVPQQRVSVEFDPHLMRLFDGETEQALTRM